MLFMPLNISAVGSVISVPGLELDETRLKELSVLWAPEKLR